MVEDYKQTPLVNLAIAVVTLFSIMAFQIHFNLG
jgi:hypothetical protein